MALVAKTPDRTNLFENPRWGWCMMRSNSFRSAQGLPVEVDDIKREAKTNPNIKEVLEIPMLKNVL